jgi:hypothetical protein
VSRQRVVAKQKPRVTPSSPTRGFCFSFGVHQDAKASRHSLVAPLAITRLAQRWRTKNIRIQSGVALSTTVRSVYFTLAGPREDRS